MKRKTILILAAVMISASMAQSEQVRLTKALFSLDDFYYNYVNSRSSTQSSEANTKGAAVASAYRDAIQYELLADTLWVKVFITADTAAAPNALDHFRSMTLRSLSQFGNIFAARIDVLQLPALDRLTFVQRIEPVVPDGYSARAAVPQTSPDIIVKKK